VLVERRALKKRYSLHNWLERLKESSSCMAKRLSPGVILIKRTSEKNELKFTKAEFPQTVRNLTLGKKGRFREERKRTTAM